MNLPQLAIAGGLPVFPDGPPSWPIADDDILHNVQLALADGSWGQYEARWTELLIEKMKDLSQCESTLLCASGTIAVEIALRAIDIKPGQEVILAAYDFPGNFRAIESIGAKPVIVDVVPNGWVVDPQQVEDSITSDTAAVIGSHLHGQLLDVKRIRQICDAANIFFVEDVCQCPGATIDNQHVGSFGDIAVFSFGGSKLLSAGRGGAITTNNADFFQRAKIYCNRGNDAFPLSQIQAAALLPQFDKLRERNLLRGANVTRLCEAIASVDMLQTMSQNIEGALCTSFYKLPWLMNLAQTDWTRDDFIGAVRAEGVALDAGFRGFTRRSAKRCRHHGTLTHSRIAAQQTVILHHPVLLESESIIDRVATALLKVIGGN